VGAALKLTAGFGLAAGVVVFVLVVLAAYPNPLWTTLLLAPPLIVGALLLDSARRRRSSFRQFGRGPAERRAEAPRIAEAAERFNATAFPRTVAGIAKALGPPHASIAPLTDTTDSLAVTVAWDLSWYQYRVDDGPAEPVRLESRGEELHELDERYKAWNTRVTPDGRLQPEA
jgi:hypothetical protein